eukprot:TRINITY_DN5126_c0_g3_i2.p1 TRINITY_DN5126_c0_g3~~TRINITY_DN5126_c0_g3_i2.p1  ORF type:complete len:455 (-),score=71.81 TRINITY_DN5126_c0_g3_i2:946-2310(-)
MISCTKIVLLFLVAQLSFAQPGSPDEGGDVIQLQILVAEDVESKEQEEEAVPPDTDVENATAKVKAVDMPAYGEEGDPTMPSQVQDPVFDVTMPEAVPIPQVEVIVDDNSENVEEEAQDVASYGRYADELVNCTDFVPQEQLASGYENCSQIIDSITSFENLGLKFSLCDSEVVWKWGYCQKTCGLCVECEDNPYPEVALDCGTVESVGLCKEMEIYWDAVYCARSCQTCEVLAERQGGSGCNNAKTIQCDMDALLAFKSSMSPSAQEDLSSWTGSNPCESWKGITCNQEGYRVSKIQLGDYIRTKNTCTCTPYQPDCPPEDCRTYTNATGHMKDVMYSFQESNGSYVSGMYTSIPVQFSQLTYLETLELTGNEITGTLPPEMSMMSRLQHLVLFDNKINGTVPNELTSFGQHMHVFDIEPQYDDKLCIVNATAEYLEANIQMETDLGQLTFCP